MSAQREYEPTSALDRYRDPITLMVCPDCGCAVLDTQAHDRYHDPTPPPPPSGHTERTIEIG